ncbi:hypothetical protein NDU88_008979 [Pleurodeles waltl]|uniref:Uncharacterized protein n=1 Tax=Pleurodeles waltl TaxID=8319 RepID=A0AAV7P6M8_PLEWA|nr:hypothetical protein NDU88_008979 [Pleurodeles waltl]
MYSTSARNALSASRAPRPSAVCPGSGGLRGRPLPMGGSGLRGPRPGCNTHPEPIAVVIKRRRGVRGSRGPNRPLVRLPPSPLFLRPRAPQSGGAAAASTHPAHTLEASARGDQPAPGLPTLPRLPDPGSSQNRLKYRRQTSRGEAPGVRSLSAPIRMDFRG